MLSIIVDTFPLEALIDEPLPIHSCFKAQLFLGAGFVHGGMIVLKQERTVDTKLERCLTLKYPFIETLWMDFVVLTGSMTSNLLLMLQTCQICQMLGGVLKYRKTRDTIYSKGKYTALLSA